MRKAWKGEGRGRVGWGEGEGEARTRSKKVQDLYIQNTNTAPQHMNYFL